MGSVKVHYKEAVWQWIAENTLEVYDKFAFPTTFTMMWKWEATIENAVKGFKVVGIYPFNPQAVDEHKA